MNRSKRQINTDKKWTEAKDNSQLKKTKTFQNCTIYVLVHSIRAMEKQIPWKPGRKLAIRLICREDGNNPGCRPGHMGNIKLSHEYSIYSGSWEHLSTRAPTYFLFAAKYFNGLYICIACASGRFSTAEIDMFFQGLRLVCRVLSCP